MVYMRVPKGAKSINKVPNWFGNKPQKIRHTWPKVWSLSLKEQNFIMVIVKLVKVMAKRNSIGSIQNNQLMGDPQRLCNSDCPLMSLTYRQESFKNSWTQTDGGIDGEIHNASFSRYLHISLRTKLLWHFVPTFLSVQGTVFEQAFLVHASAIWASHWPEDVTYGEKPVHERTALLKQAIYPSGFSRGDLDVEDLELHLGVDQYEARAIKRDKVAQMMLHHFFLDNILTYQRILHGYSEDESKKMWRQMMNSIQRFLLQAVTKYRQYIVCYGLPSSAWRSSLDEAVLLWDVHNHLPASFHQECLSWPRYRYLMNVQDEGPHRLLAWEYPLQNLALFGYFWFSDKSDKVGFDGQTSSAMAVGPLLDTARIWGVCYIEQSATLFGIGLKKSTIMMMRKYGNAQCKGLNEQ
ncbi:hypothetical protein GG344DRAFT_68825 [Lentinula edodes]|nr:hypothetical protein GG344DRAFT_68825 [Lentinula edodes]